MTCGGASCRPVHRQLPSGTVSFLFTDVEGSTQLLQSLGAVEYAVALTEHRRVLREAFSRHGGVEVDTQGDAFFVAFPTATGALAAAAAATEGLAAGPIRVRIGIHTGTPEVVEQGYVGVDVHRAARASLLPATVGRSCSQPPRLDEDLPTVAGSSDASRPVHIDPNLSLLDDLWRSGVDADANPGSDPRRALPSPRGQPPRARPSPVGKATKASPCGSAAATSASSAIRPTRPPPKPASPRSNRCRRQRLPRS